MSVLWILPLLFIAVGAALVAGAVRRTAEAAVSLREECARLEELRAALVGLRIDTGVTRSTLEGLRSRSKSGPTRG